MDSVCAEPSLSPRSSRQCHESSTRRPAYSIDRSSTEQIAQIHVLHAPRSNLRRKLTIKDLSNAHQRRDQIDAWHVIDVVDLHVASYTLVAAALDRALEYMRVVKVLHRLCA